MLKGDSAKSKETNAVYYMQQDRDDNSNMRNTVKTVKYKAPTLLVYIWNNYRQNIITRYKPSYIWVL